MTSQPFIVKNVVLTSDEYADYVEWFLLNTNNGCVSLAIGVMVVLSPVWIAAAIVSWIIGDWTPLAGVLLFLFIGLTAGATRNLFAKMLAKCWLLWYRKYLVKPCDRKFPFMSVDYEFHDDELVIKYRELTVIWKWHAVHSVVTRGTILGIQLSYDKQLILPLRALPSDWQTRYPHLAQAGAAPHQSHARKAGQVRTPPT